MAANIAAVSYKAQLTGQLAAITGYLSFLHILVDICCSVLNVLN